MSAANIFHSHRGICPCCGDTTAYTRGDVERNGERVARYLIKWTVGNPSHGMAWLVSVKEPVSGKEVSVSLNYSFEHNGFMVRDLEDYPWLPEDLAGFGEFVSRSRVITSPLAKHVFEVVDDIWASDPYVGDFVAFGKK